MCFDDFDYFNNYSFKCKIKKFILYSIKMYDQAIKIDPNYSTLIITKVKTINMIIIYRKLAI